MGRLAGTAGDNLLGFNSINIVEYTLYVDTGGYYNAANLSFHSGIPIYNSATADQADWSQWHFDSVPFVSGRRYTFVTRATDKAGNAQTNFQVNVNSVTFTYDTVAPSSRVKFPVHNS